MMFTELFEKHRVESVSIVIALISILVMNIISSDNGLLVAIFVGVVTLLFVPIVLGSPDEISGSEELHRIFVIIMTGVMVLATLTCYKDPLSVRFFPFIAIGLCGIPVLVRTLSALSKGKFPVTHLLMSIVIVAGFFVADFEVVGLLSVVLFLMSMFAYDSKHPLSVSDYSASYPDNITVDGIRHKVILDEINIGDGVTISSVSMISEDGSVKEIDINTDIPAYCRVSSDNPKVAAKDT